jgi:outer membrane protein assembly factor BamD
MNRTLSFLAFISLIFITLSCKFQHVLKKGDADQKYEMAMKLYESKDYSRAIQLFEQLMGVVRATDKAQKIYYCYAYAYYYQKEYTLASYYFKRYSTNFPNTPEAEECSFYSAYCNYLNSPDYNLDQTSTYEALKELQLFTNTYPTSPRVSECNDLIDKLRVKLEYKDYKIAKMYYRMEEYAAAIQCFNNILKEYTDSPHKEEVLYLILQSSTKYASESIDEKKKERYKKALTAYNDLVSLYPQSQYMESAKELKSKIQKELEASASGKQKTSMNLKINK